jgi:hypothetical protein
MRRLLRLRRDRTKPFQAKRKSRFPILGWPVALNHRDTTGYPRLTLSPPPLPVPPHRLILMPNCRSCGERLSEARANASIFAISYLPVNRGKRDRAKAIEMAERIGPLCPKCLGRRQDLAISPEK